MKFLLCSLTAGLLGLKQCQGVSEMRDAIGQRRTCQRLAAGQMKILHRLPSVTAAPIVMCQLIQMVIQPARLKRFNGVRGTFMQRGTLFPEQ